MPTKLTFN